MMAALEHKIDFIGFVLVMRANPNGDPLNGNQPRTDYDGYGEISDVCLKRKIRNRLQDMGEAILVQSNDRSDDGFTSIRERVEANPSLEKILKMKGKEKGCRQKFADEASKAWIDVRSFGQVFALKQATSVDSVSIGVRGPVSVYPAFSMDPVTITDQQITKSTNGEPGEKKGSDTMGMKHRVDFGLYKFQGSINVQLAEKTGFSEEDAEKIKQALVTLFENDASSARPEGSLSVERLYWIKHPGKTGIASAKIHRSVTAVKRDGVDRPRAYTDYTIDDSALKALPNLNIEIYEEGERR